MGIHDIDCARFLLRIGKKGLTVRKITLKDTYEEEEDLTNNESPCY